MPTYQPSFRVIPSWSVQAICVSVEEEIYSLTSRTFMPKHQRGGRQCCLVKQSLVFRYRNDVILKGQVGGKCDKLNLDLLEKRADELSYLQSW